MYKYGNQSFTDKLCVYLGINIKRENIFRYIVEIIKIFSKLLILY